MNARKVIFLRITLLLLAGSFLLGNLIILPIVYFHESIAQFIGWVILTSIIVVYLYAHVRKMNIEYLALKDKHNKTFLTSLKFSKMYVLRIAKYFGRFFLYVISTALFFLLCYYLIALNINIVT